MCGLTWVAIKVKYAGIHWRVSDPRVREPGEDGPKARGPRATAAAGGSAVSDEAPREPWAGCREQWRSVLADHGCRCRFMYLEERPRCNRRGGSCKPNGGGGKWVVPGGLRRELRRLSLRN